MYNHKYITSNDVVRNKFQLKLSNRFENLQINEDDTVKSPYYKLEEALSEAAPNSLLQKEKITNKPWVSTKSLDLLNSNELHAKK